MKKLILTCLILGGFIITPIVSVTGQLPEVQWKLKTYNIPDTIRVDQSFSISFYIDAEGNDIARDQYNETSFVMRFNITLSDGLQWIWQSPSQQLSFWTMFDVTKVAGVTTQKLDIIGTAMGFHEIHIEMQSDPAIGNITQKTIGLWVLPSDYRDPQDLLSKPLLVMVFCILFGILIGFFGRPYWDARKKNIEKKEADK